MYVAKARLWGFFFTICYIFLLIAFYPFISEVYASQGVVLAPDFNGPALILFLIYAIIPMFFLPLTLQKPSFLTIWVLYLVLYIPCCIIIVMMGQIPFYANFLYNTSCLLSLLLLNYLTRIKPLNIKLINFNRYKLFLYTLFWLFILFMIAIFIYYFAPILKIVSFLEVYSQRAAYTNTLSEIQVPGVVYLIGWIGQVLSPLLLIIGIFERKKFIIALGIILALLIYAAAAFKGVIFLPFIILLLYWLLKKSWLNFNMLAGLFCVIVIFSFFSAMFASFITVRTIITSGVLSSWYINFALHNPLIYLSNSILKYFISYPYNLSPSFVIAKYNTGVAYDANANLWASGTADFGYVFGPLFATFILFLFLWVYDSIAMRLKGVHQGYYLLSSIMLLSFILAVINSAIFTALLTSGGIIILLLLYIIASTKIKE